MCYHHNYDTLNAQFENYISKDALSELSRRSDLELLKLKTNARQYPVKI